VEAKAPLCQCRYVPGEISRDISGAEIIRELFKKILRL